MSACISNQGEYSYHVPGEGADEFLCQRCYVFDEDAALAEVAGLRTQLAERDALIKRMAVAASTYGARVYMVGYEPLIAQHLTEDEIRLNHERPSEADARVAHERDGLAGQVDAIRALPDWQACTCRDDTPVGIGHHAARRGYNEALAVVRAALAASSPTTRPTRPESTSPSRTALDPEAKK